jgi:small-conductance mechanosensitive channel
VDTMLPVKSELLFDLLKRLRKARIDIPMPRRPQELLHLAPDENQSGMLSGDVETVRETQRAKK